MHLLVFRGTVLPRIVFVRRAKVAVMFSVFSCLWFTTTSEAEEFYSNRTPSVTVEELAGSKGWSIGEDLVEVKILAYGKETGDRESELMTYLFDHGLLPTGAFTLTNQGPALRYELERAGLITNWSKNYGELLCNLNTQKRCRNSTPVYADYDTLKVPTLRRYPYFTFDTVSLNSESFSGAVREISNLLPQEWTPKQHGVEMTREAYVEEVARKYEAQLNNPWKNREIVLPQKQGTVFDVYVPRADARNTNSRLHNFGDKVFIVRNPEKEEPPQGNDETLGITTAAAETADKKKCSTLESEHAKKLAAAGIHIDFSELKKRPSNAARVGVIDEVFTRDHPEFRDETYSPFPCTPMRTVKSGDPDHGLFIAGLLEAKQNGFGIVGAVSKSITVSIPKRNDRDLVAYINKSLTEDSLPKILNVSWKGKFTDWSQTEILVHRLRARTLWVAAAGNSRKDLTEQRYCLEFPLCLFRQNNVVTVAALDSKGDDLSSESNYGRFSVHIAAPGEELLGIVQGGLGTGTGTSFAAPFVSAAAAMIQEKFPDIPPRRLRNRLLYTADFSRPSINDRVEFGVLDVSAAINSENIKEDLLWINGRKEPLRGKLIPVGELSGLYLTAPGVDENLKKSRLLRLIREKGVKKYTVIGLFTEPGGELVLRRYSNVSISGVSDLADCDYQNGTLKNEDICKEKPKYMLKMANEKQNVMLTKVDEYVARLTKNPD